MTSPSPKEHEIQETVFQWIDVHRGQHPELRWVHAIPNGEKRPPRTGAQLKRQGVRRGVPDISCPVPRHGFHGLYIEVKTLSGELSGEQEEWIDGLRSMGYKADVLRSVPSICGRLVEYLGLPESLLRGL
jgi:hypothetical protein